MTKLVRRSLNTAWATKLKFHRSLISCNLLRKYRDGFSDRRLKHVKLPFGPMRV